MREAGEVQQVRGALPFRAQVLFQAEGRTTPGFGGNSQKTAKMLICSLRLFRKLESDAEPQEDTRGKYGTVHVSSANGASRSL